MKCDFCDNEAIGYCSMQCAIYCEYHKEQALEIERNMWAELDKVQQEIYDPYEGD